MTFINTLNSLIILSLSIQAFASQDPKSKEEIKNKISQMIKHEQQLRQEAVAAKNLKDERIFKIDQENTKILKEILSNYNWLTISEFGSETDHNCWLLVQHSPDLIFQKNILNILEKLYQSKETSAKNYAYLYDRIAMYENRPQRYGTQGNIKDGKWVAHEIEDIQNLDNRRLTVGLPSYKEYLNQINKFYNLV